ncbi:MAG: ABC transporter permease [Candidatus Methanomethyliaceae archaeon]|nr:ABC transporter permease [Candidatus Methanomethyliaceae archaeon]MDW7970779.1 ABC transporter permease [Nitrososphaerota archaeon]
MEGERKMNEIRPSFLRGFLALTYRELKKWLNDPIMIVMLILQPLIWMGLLGKSINIQGLFSAENIEIPSEIILPGIATIPPSQGFIILNGTYLSRIFEDIGSKIMQSIFGVEDYFSFMSIGMISMIVVMTTMFSGISIVWDRRLGFLDKVISTPVSRAAIIFSKIANSTLRAIFQASVILALAYLLGLRISNTFTIMNILGIYLAIFLMSAGLSSIFIAFSIRSTRVERPMQLINLIMMPLIFSSNIFFPTELMPNWLQAVVNINPITYLTDAIRQLTIMEINVQALIIDFIYLSIFATILTVIGIVLSWYYLTK